MVSSVYDFGGLYKDNYNIVVLGYFVIYYLCLIIVDLLYMITYEITTSPYHHIQLYCICIRHLQI